MVQGSMKLNKSAKKKSSHSVQKIVHKSAQAKKGSTTALPKGIYRSEAVLDRKLSKAINIANEKKVASKLVQDGGRLSLKDVMTVRHTRVLILV